MAASKLTALTIGYFAAMASLVILFLLLHEITDETCDNCDASIQEIDGDNEIFIAGIGVKKDPRKPRVLTTDRSPFNDTSYDGTDLEDTSVNTTLLSREGVLEVTGTTFTSDPSANATSTPIPLNTDNDNDDTSVQPTSDSVEDVTSVESVTENKDENEYDISAFKPQSTTVTTEVSNDSDDESDNNDNGVATNESTNGNESDSESATGEGNNITTTTDSDGDVESTTSSSDGTDDDVTVETLSPTSTSGSDEETSTAKGIESPLLVPLTTDAPESIETETPETDTPDRSLATETNNATVDSTLGEITETEVTTIASQTVSIGDGGQDDGTTETTRSTVTEVVEESNPSTTESSSPPSTTTESFAGSEEPKTECDKIFRAVDACLEKLLVWKIFETDPEATDRYRCVNHKENIACIGRYRPCLTKFERTVYHMNYRSIKTSFYATCDDTDMLRELKYHRERCVTNKNTSEVVQVLRRGSRSMRHALKKASLDNLLPWACCAYERMLTTAKPPLYRICDDGKANVTASVEFFVAYWRTITGAMVNRSCLKYNTMAKCEKELPGSEKILDTYFSVPYVPEEEFSFMTKMILVLDRMVDRHPESVSTSK